MATKQVSTGDKKVEVIGQDAAVKPAAKPKQVRAKVEKNVIVLVQRGVQIAIPILEGLSKVPEVGSVVHISATSKIVDDGSKRLKNPNHAVIHEIPASQVVTKLNAVCIAEANEDKLAQWMVAAMIPQVELD